MPVPQRAQWIRGSDGRTRYRGQLRRGRQLDAALDAQDSRQMRAAVAKAEDALVAYLETHPMTHELVEVVGQLDLALRFADGIESRPTAQRRPARVGACLPVIGR
ncbi:MAG: hypothetical protein NT062_19580 [Proteobacteria bacterium]|nr:hypothetical protein [Pseudomonadota bacterium]